MQQPACPHCGAPAPGQFPPGTTMVTCGYCKQSYPAPQANMPPPPQYQQPMQQQQAPRIVVLHTHSTYDNSNEVVDAVRWGYWIFRAFIPFVVITIIIGLSVVSRVLRHSHRGGLDSIGAWDGTAPFECGGNDEMYASNVTAKFNAGTAISAGGNCHFTCTNCSVTAPTAIEVTGNGSVTMVNGTVIGTDVLADASGNGHVNVSGNVVASGQVKQSGNAKVSAPRSTAAAVATTPPAVAATTHATPMIHAPPPPLPHNGPPPHSPFGSSH